VYLAALGDFLLLRKLFGEIAIPRAVFQEVVVGGAGLPAAHAVQGAIGSWLSVSGIANTSEAARLRHTGCMKAKANPSCSLRNSTLKRC
jgi:predicted nucleic acid-binding protein